VQFALWEVGEKARILVTAQEIMLMDRVVASGVPDKDLPLVELAENEDLPLKVVYGLYMPARPETTGQMAAEDAAKAVGYGLAFLDKSGVGQILGLTDLWLFPPLVRRCAHGTEDSGRNFPFAALVETRHEFDNTSTQSVAAFLRYGNLSLMTNILNRPGVFAIHRQERRSKTVPTQDNWRGLVDQKRACETAARVR
jgi:hypothetical protein